MNQSITLPFSEVAPKQIRSRLSNAKKKFFAKLHEQNGDSHLVAIILVICVTIALCTIFQKQIYGLFVNTVFPNLSTAAKSFTNYSGS